MIENKIIFKQESYAIIGAALEVHNILGCGFAEKVYQEAFEHELYLRDIPYEREKSLKVTYKGVVLPKSFRVDFVCFDQIVVELKAVSNIISEFKAQVYNYLKIGGFQLGLLLNFGNTKLESYRIPCATKWNQDNQLIINSKST